MMLDCIDTSMNYPYRAKCSWCGKEWYSVVPKGHQHIVACGACGSGDVEIYGLRENVGYDPTSSDDVDH
jgi:transcription elongation factor Elf1